MIDPRVVSAHPLHELLEEEKRQQAKQDEEGDGRPSGTLLSDQEFDKLQADVVNDPSVAPGLAQSSPRPRFDPHQPMPSDIWPQPGGNVVGDFPPPPPPPYPGTGRMTPGGHMRPAYMPDHRSPMTPMAPHPPGRMPMMPGAGMKEMRQEELLRANEADAKDRLSVKEKDLTQLRKRRKTLMGRQKTLRKNGEELNSNDASFLEQITGQDIPVLAKEVESLRNEYKGHQRNLQEFTMKMQERMMQWGGGGHMMPRYPNYGPGMGGARMRGMYGQSRPLDPRQVEMERQHRHRMQMMHGQGMRPGMHPVQRPYIENSLESNSGMFGAPRYPGMSTRMPMKMDGSEYMDEEKRQFMMQQNSAMVRPGMRPMAPDMAPRMPQPQQMQPRFPGANSCKPRESAPVPTSQKQKSASVPKSSASAASKQPSKEDPPEKSSLHTATIPTSFPGQHLYPPPKSIVSAVPFTSGQNKHVPGALESMPKEAMTSLGDQYPLKIVKAEPKPEAKPEEAKPELKAEVKAKPGADGDCKPVRSPAVSKSEATSKSAPPKTSSASASTVGADGTTLEDRIEATINDVARRAAEMADSEEQMEEESIKEAEKRSLAAQAGYTPHSPAAASHVKPALSESTEAPKQEATTSNSVHRLGIPVSVVTNNQERIFSSADLTQAGAPAQTLRQPDGHPDGRGDSPSSNSNALLKRLLENVPAAQSSGNSRSMLATITPEEQRQMGPYAPPATYDPFPWNAQTGFTPEAWARLPRKERQHVYEARMTPNGQIITDNGTIISVPTSSRPPPSPMSMHPGLSKNEPLRAMQNMRSALVADPGMAPQVAAAAMTAPKKKRPPQSDKKKRPKAATPGTPSQSVPETPAPAAPGSNVSAALSESNRLYEELKQVLRAQPMIALQEPTLVATSYMETLPVIKPLRLPNQRVISRPKPPKLTGEYGRACIEGQCDIYYFSPYTNVAPPVLRPSSALSTDSPFKKGGPSRGSKTPESTQPSEVYDISRFQKVMTKTQMLDLSLPSPPLLKPIDVASLPMSPVALLEPVSPDCCVEDCVYTEKARRDINYPYLKPIKHASSEQLSAVDGRLSPDIPLHAPVPVRVPYFGMANRPDVKREAQISSLDSYNKDPFGSMAEDELKSTAVGIQSSLQSAIRESPSNQVSVTLTLTSEAAQDIPNVLSKLADLLRMAAPPVPCHVDETSKGDQKALEPAVAKASVCCHCDQTIAVGVALVRTLKDLGLPSLDSQEDIDKECRSFCSETCLGQYTLSKHGELSKRPHQHLRLREALVTSAEQKPDAKVLANKGNQKKVKRKIPEAVVEPTKKWKGLRWRRWDIKVTFDLHKYDPPTEEDIQSTLRKVAQLVRTDPLPVDKRACILCQRVGDGDNAIASRLLNYDVDKWVHLNCALWSTEVYETLNGALMNVDNNIQKCLKVQCVICGLTGATLLCFKPRCTNLYHLPCAQQHGAMFFQDKTLLCPLHMPTDSPERLKSLTVTRKVYINRDESLQIANAVKSDDKQCCVRIGAVVYYNIGQLFTHQILTGRFHTRDYIYPVGYKCVRFFWSTRYPNKRCCYECSIAEGDEGAPIFLITIKEPGHSNKVYKDVTPKAVWSHILTIVERQRRMGDCVKIFPEFLSGEYMFGLKELAIIRIIESLPGTELLAGYAFKFGKTQLIEMPPAINPTGCARSEPKLRTHFRKPHTLQTSSSRSAMLPSVTTVALPGDINSPYHKQFVHSKSQQYRKLKNEWSNYVYLGRSRIQGLGMFAARDIEKHTMVIEYIGEVIRNELAEFREKIYEEHNRGVYMFRNSVDYVIDATMSGGPARYINHSCDPNCVTETVNMDKDVKIVIIALRRISKGEELNYDYKFDLEDDSSKIPCNCGASNCRKWMN
ncbi:histone-lysine N-methyltransferase 2C-like isoform X2 [Watersipora subatra]|uniref:histone-lysine N-methyltransferase 2C-like isoform X2 n=1 Tax=Watersipora subatra TaxID=2589382 RepID=UPI00355BE051